MSAETRADTRDLDAEYAEIIFRLSRAVRRRVRLDWPHRPLSESGSEVLRLAYLEPGIRVSEVATRLGLARNTVSTLVGQLSTQGLLEREADPSDGRVVRLAPSDEARRRIAAWRDLRRRSLGRVMGDLLPAERRAMGDAILVLRHLIDLLEEG